MKQEPVQLARFETHQAVYILSKPLDSFMIGMDGFDPIIMLAMMDKGYVFVSATDARTGTGGSVIVPFSNIRYMQPVQDNPMGVEVEVPIFGEDEPAAKPKVKAAAPKVAKQANAKAGKVLSAPPAP